LSCPPRTLKSAEYDSLNLQRRIAYWFSVIIGLLQIVNLSILKRARQNIFVLCAVVGIFAMSLLIVIQIEVYGGHTETSSCSSNASWYAEGVSSVPRTRIFDA
jgi:intracellular septation protein A